GIEAALPFEAGIDPAASKARDASGRDVCMARFDIFVANRQALATDKPVTRKYWPIHEDQRSILLNFVACDRKEPRYVSESGVKVVASLTIDLSTSMHLPVTSRTVEVAMYFGQTHVRAEARNVATNEPQSVEIKWHPTW